MYVMHNRFFNGRRYRSRPEASVLHAKPVARRRGSAPRMISRLMLPLALSTIVRNHCTLSWWLTRLRMVSQK